MAMRQLKVPQSVVVSVVLALFGIVLYALRQYGLVGEARDLLIALAAGGICALMIAGLIYSNYESYMQRRNGSVNSTS